LRREGKAKEEKGKRKEWKARESTGRPRKERQEQGKLTKETRGNGKPCMRHK